MEKDNNYKIPGLRDVKIFIKDEDRPAEDKTVEPTKEPTILVAPNGLRWSIPVRTTAEGEAWLRYYLLIRPMLYEPLEYRRN